MNENVWEYRFSKLFGQKWNSEQRPAHEDNNRMKISLLRFTGSAVLLVICSVLMAQPHPENGPVSVLDYGAQCDGSADDKGAIQNAIDRVRASGGGLITF